MHAVESWVLGIAGEWWVIPIVALLSCVDGFFPTVPSESVLVTLGSLSSSSGHPRVWWLILAGWLGACAGDHITYAIGRWLGWDRFRFFREGKGRAAIDAAERGLERHALVYFATARFIPLGRTAVNLSAGALEYPQRAFTGRIVIATLMWASYSTLLGYGAGHWFREHPLAGIGVALLLALLMSLMLERLARVLRAALDRAHTRRRTRGE